MKTKLEHALALQGLGFRLFPLVMGGKTPAVQGGVKRATDDIDQITEWWRAMPLANIGIAGGSDLLVIDLDEKGEKHGITAWLDMHSDLTDRDLVAMWTWSVRTPTGGMHLYYKPSVPLGSSVERLGPGIDTRGHYGYVVAPGSIVDGKTYEWIRPPSAGPMVELPSFIEEVLKAAPEREVDADKLPDDLDRPDMIAVARGVLRQAVLDGEVAVEGASGDATTYEMACRVREFAISWQTAFDLMATEWNPHCIPRPWPADMLEEKILNAYAYAQNKVLPPNGGLVVDDDDELLEDLEPEASPETGLRFHKKPSEFLKMPRPSWMIENVLQNDSLVTLYGPTGVAKTFVALDLALSIASGRRWLPGHDQIGPVPVSYLACEAPVVVRERVAAWMDMHDDLCDLVEENFYLGMDLKEFRDEEFMKALRLEEKLIGARLIVVDTFQEAAGAIEENASKDMIDILCRIKKLRIVADACVMIVHHSTKAGGQARGAGHLIQAMDTILRVGSPAKDFASLKMEKSRSGRLPDGPWHFKASSAALDNDVAVFSFTTEKPAGKPGARLMAAAAMLPYVETALLEWPTTQGLVTDADVKRVLCRDNPDLFDAGNVGDNLKELRDSRLANHLWYVPDGRKMPRWRGQWVDTESEEES